MILVGEFKNLNCNIKDIEDAKMFHQEEYQRFEFDYQIRVGDIDNYYNGEIARAQSDGDNEFVEFLMQEKQREKDDAFNEYQFRIFDQQAYETQDLQKIESSISKTKKRILKEILPEKSRTENLI